MDSLDLGVMFDLRRDPQRARRVALHPEPERHHPAHREPGLERGHRPTRLDHQVAQRFPPVIGARDHAAGVIVMPSEILRRGMQHEVEPEPNRVAERGGRERVVDGGGHAMPAAERGQRLEVCDRHRRVRDGFRVEERRAGKRAVDRVEIPSVDQIHRHPEPRHHGRREGERTAVQRVRRDDPLTGRDVRRPQRVDRGHAARERHRRLGSFERRDQPLEGVDRRVPVAAGVRVAGREERDRVRVGVGVGEPERGRLVQGNAGRLLVDRRQRRPVDRSGLEPALAHPAQPSGRRPSAWGIGRAGRS